MEGTEWHKRSYGTGAPPNPKECKVEEMGSVRKEERDSGLGMLVSNFVFGCSSLPLLMVLTVFSAHVTSP